MGTIELKFMVLRMNNKFSTKTRNNKLLFTSLTIIAGIWILIAGIMGSWFYSQWQELKSGKLHKINPKELTANSDASDMQAIGTSSETTEPSEEYMLKNWTMLIQASNYVCDSANDFRYRGESNIGKEFKVNCDEYTHNYKVFIRPNSKIYVIPS
jgi:hypothetical protein